MARPGGSLTLFWSTERTAALNISPDVGDVVPATDEITLTVPPDVAAGVSNEPLIRSGDRWKFNDRGIDFGTVWREHGFNDSNWAEGPSELGFGDGDEATELQNGQPSFYFRKTFLMTGVNPTAQLELRVKADDGVAVFVNGNEVARNNLLPGPVGFGTFALSPSNEANPWVTFTLPVRPFFVDGENTIAISVHNVNFASSDISFDCELKPINNEPSVTYIFTATNPTGTATAGITVGIENRPGEDTDNDGLPDDWELKHFGNLDQSGTDDSDNDGTNNFGEFDGGRNPALPDSGPAITSLTRTENNLVISIPPVFDYAVGIEYSQDFSPGSWIELGNFFDGGTESVFIDPDSTRVGRREGYYRAFRRPTIR